MQAMMRKEKFMKNKLYAMLVVSIFAVTVTGCGEKSEVATEQEVSNQEDSLKQAEEVAQDTAEGKNSMYVFEDSDDGNLAAITFLGYGDQEKEKNFATFCEQYQLDAEKFVEVVDVEDCEWYAIIPKYTKEELKRMQSHVFILLEGSGT